MLNCRDHDRDWNLDGRLKAAAGLNDRDGGPAGGRGRVRGGGGCGLVVAGVVDRSGRIGALVEDVDEDRIRGEVVRGASVISGVRLPRGQDHEAGVPRAEGNVKIGVVIDHAAVVIPRRKVRR